MTSSKYTRKFGNFFRARNKQTNNGWWEAQSVELVLECARDFALKKNGEEKQGISMKCYAFPAYKSETFRSQLRMNVPEFSCSRKVIP